MTDAILAMSIAGIFTGWIWTLKHELTALHTQLPAGIGPQPERHEPVIVRQHPAHKAEHAVRPAHPTARRSSDGVRMFVISET